MLKECKWLLIFAFALILLIPLTNAGIWDWITGKATSATHTVSISLGNTAPNITRVSFETTTLTPVQGTYTTINFSFLVTDPDGAGNVDTTYAVANASIFGANYDIRENTSCSYVGVAGSDVNFTCQIKMWYWDNATGWNITVQARDLSNVYTSNRSNYFTYSTLTSYDFGPSSMSFSGVTPGSSNKTATREYLVNNSGNDASKFLSINASNLYNSTVLATPSSYFLAAENFTVDIETGGYAECDISGGAFRLINLNYKNITGSYVFKGNFTLNNGTGQRRLYYCLNNVSSSLPSGTYDTTKLGPWYVKVVS